MSNYTRWYRDGTLNATKGSTEVTGSGTYWESAGLNPGDMLEVNNNGVMLEIASINSDTSITLANAYQGNTVTGSAYAIVRNFTATMPSKVAAQTAELLHDFKKYIETDMDRITGRSAYEIAKLHGFVGTEAEWLESLKGAGEIADHAAQLNYLNNVVINGSGASHNASYYANYLGSQITAQQLANIKNGSFKDIYPGTNWRFSVSGATIYAVVVGCNILQGRGFGSSVNEHLSRNLHHIVLWLQGFTAKLNDTADTTGGLANSKLFTEKFPQWLEDLTSVIPAEAFIGIMDSISDAGGSNGAVTHTVLSVDKMFLPSPFNIYGWHDSREFYSTINNVIWPATFYKSNLAMDWNSFMWNCACSGTQWGCHQPHKARNVMGVDANTDMQCWPYVVIGLPN